MKIRDILDSPGFGPSPAWAINSRASARWWAQLLVQSLILVGFTLSPAFAQQVVTYPAPSFQGLPPLVSISDTSTITISGCPTSNGTSTSSNNFQVYLVLPLNLIQPVFPSSWAVLPPISIPSNVYTVSGGVSEGQGTYSGTGGPTAIGLNGGTDTETKAYNLTVSGVTFSETFSDRQLADLPGHFQNYLYTLTSTYNIVSGIQVFTWNRNIDDIQTPSPGCSSHSVITDAGTFTYNYNARVLSIVTSSLPDGTVNVVYPALTLAATGGSGSYTWSASGLPTGLAVNAQTGVISGTPTQSGQASVVASVTDSLGDTASKALPLTVVGCPAVSVVPVAGGEPSRDGLPTAMTASFTPTMNDMPISLNAAAESCGFVGFDWQQTFDHLPPPSLPSKCFSSSPTPCFAAASAPHIVLTAPPAFYDPPLGGYTWENYDDQAYPFYYNPADVPTGCAEGKNGVCIKLITSEDGTTLNFFDSPDDPLLPQGGYMGFTTRLVGVLGTSNPNNVGPLLYRWSWISTYNDSTGGAQAVSSAPVDGSGTGGVTITSINGVAQTPPSTTCTATPTTLWPPNGTLISVTVSGNISAGTSALTTTSYAVHDEYGQVKPRGSITLGPTGSYTFAVPLIAARNGDDPDGRTYTINVTGSDKIGNVGACSAVVTVPHDQGQ